MNEVSLIKQVSGPIAEKSVRDKIESLEKKLMAMPQVEIPAKQCYFGGIYAREITIPKGTLLTGKIYRDDHFDIMISGDITVSSDGGVKRLQGFHVFEGHQGKKRAGIAHEDTRWITFCKSDEVESGEYVKHLTADSFDELDSFLDSRKPYVTERQIKQSFECQASYKGSSYNDFRKGYLAASSLPSKAEADRNDYKKVLAEYGFTEETVRTQSEDSRDQINIDSDCMIKESDIEGVGLYSKIPIEAGHAIMPGRINGKRTMAGRYTNHSIEPNAIMVMNDEDDIELIAIKDIDGEEITVDYRVCLNLQIRKVA